jgi:hypothetical protein
MGGRQQSSLPYSSVGCVWYDETERMFRMFDFLDNTTLYYLFSTISQTIATFVALVGIAVTYALQSRKERIDIFRKSIRELLEDPKSMLFWNTMRSKSGLSIKDEIWKSFIEKRDDDLNKLLVFRKPMRTNLYTLLVNFMAKHSKEPFTPTEPYELLQEYEKKRNYLLFKFPKYCWVSIKRSLWICGINIVLSLMFIGMSERLKGNLCGLIIFIGMIIFTAICIVYVGNRFYHIIKAENIFDSPEIEQ